MTVRGNWAARCELRRHWRASEQSATRVWTAAGFRAAIWSWDSRVRRALAFALVLGACSSGGPVVTKYEGSMVTIEQRRSVPQKDATPVARATCGGPTTLLSKICTDARCTMERLIYWCR